MRPTFYACTQVSNREYKSKHEKKEKMQKELKKKVEETAKACQFEIELGARIEKNEARKAELTTELASLEEPINKQEKLAKYWSTELTKVTDVVLKSEEKILQMELHNKELKLKLNEHEKVMEKQFEMEQTTKKRLDDVKFFVTEREQ